MAETEPLAFAEYPVRGCGCPCARGAPPSSSWCLPAHSCFRLPTPPPPLTPAQFLAELGLGEDNLGCYAGGGAWRGSGAVLVSRAPATGRAIARVAQASDADYEAAFAAMQAGQRAWAETPAPVRGEVVRQIGVALRAKKQALGALVSLEMGKIASEGLGEVQETIDTCDMACGMSRTIAGQVLPSERPGHTLLEVWNPLGHVGIVVRASAPRARAAARGWRLLWGAAAAGARGSGGGCRAQGT